MQGISKFLRVRTAETRLLPNPIVSYLTFNKGIRGGPFVGGRMARNALRGPLEGNTFEDI